MNREPREPNPTSMACARCGTRGRQLKVCSGCKSAFFCDNDCSVAAWPHHKMDCRRIQANILSDRASELLSRGADEEAISELESAMKLYGMVKYNDMQEMHKNYLLSIEIAKCQAVIAVYCERQRRHEEAVQYLSAAGDAFRQHLGRTTDPQEIREHRLGLSSIQQNLGAILYRLGRFDEAACSFEATYQVRKDLAPDSFLSARTLYNIADSLLHVQVDEGGQSSHALRSVQALERALVEIRKHQHKAANASEMGQLEERAGDMLVQLHRLEDATECYDHSFRANQMMMGGINAPRDLNTRLDRTSSKLRLMKSGEVDDDSSKVCHLFNTLNLWCPA
mmetsp:Transcript_16013/g.38958  ORF Transcript_16013/g.38958 Transcript_16013/m.38958 type:complete len:337 (-) Transcript_16013:225-1235(-)